MAGLGRKRVGPKVQRSVARARIRELRADIAGRRKKRKKR